MTPTICPDCGRPVHAQAPGGLCPACLLGLTRPAPEADPDWPTPETDSEARESEGAEGSADRIGRYRLLEIIGEGGFGTVWMAEQTEPVRRKVALKIIKLGMDTRQVVARFEAERQALALMDHPNIARVFDAGATEAGRPFFVMELVRGLPISEFCDARQFSTRERIELFIHVCQAVQHAHQKGIIHRDLKPSNVLVTEQDGKAVPKIIDFGVAKAIEEPLTDKTLFTRFHQFLGTPAYMSPEQAGLGGLDIDTRTDIYALGVLLYELLTGQPPLDPRQLRDAGQEGMLKTIREVEPAKPSTRLSLLKREDLTTVAARRREDPQRLSRLVRGDLDWIALKALEKDRTRRYETANGLAADLRRYLDNEPIAARPPGNFYRLQKLARRNKLLFTAAGAVAAALVVGLVTTSWQWVRATRSLTQVRLNAYVREINVAQQALAENNFARARELLERQRPRPGSRDDWRGFEWRYLWQECQGDKSAAFSDAPPQWYLECAVTFSPDGRWLVYSGSGQVIVREVTTQLEVTNLPTAAHSLGFSPKGDTLATATLEPPRVTLWDTSTWGVSRVLGNASAPALFSPDGNWLVTETEDHKRLQLWDTQTWRPVASCPQTPILDGSLRSAVAFSPDGKLLVTPSMEIHKGGAAGLLLWKVPTLERYAQIFPKELPIQSAAFLPDSKHLVAGGWLGHLLIWDIETNPPRLIQQHREHTAYVPALAVAPGARTLVTGSADQSVCLWDIPARQLLARWRGHLREVWAVAISPDGRSVASSSPDGTIRLWNGQLEDTGEVLDDAGDIAGFLARGRTVVIAPSEVDYRWQLVTGTNRVVIPIPSKPGIKSDFNLPYAVNDIASLAALGRTEGQVEIWDLAARRLFASWKAGTNLISAVAFAPDGATLATGDDGGTVKLWETAAWTEIAAFKASSGVVQALAFSPHGDLLATGNFASNETRVWNLATRQPPIPLDIHANQAAFAPDGKSLITCSVFENEAHVWELPSGDHKAALKGHVGGTTHVAFSPDGRTLATGAYDGRIKLWNIATGQEVATLPYSGMLTSLRFSPDERTLAASLWMSPGYRVLLFRAPSLEEIAAVEKSTK